MTPGELVSGLLGLCAFGLGLYFGSASDLFHTPSSSQLSPWEVRPPSSSKHEIKTEIAVYEKSRYLPYAPSTSRFAMSPGSDPDPTG
ncbi:hypothetical protein B0T09DRAFT_348434 [Sordaria sp. MPI-SDFR-AT-0083]|nr:hypothetical protein B0T09DRAFT_348434 [Sordaria sp. MPI-SDFR-AT-0083]